MKTKSLLIAAAALVTASFVTPSASAGHRDNPAQIAHSLESDAWETVSMFDEDIRHDRRRQSPAERAFHDHLISLKHNLHNVGEALDRNSSRHTIERSISTARHTLDCAIDLKRSVHMHRETAEAFHSLVGNFDRFERSFAPVRDQHRQGHDRDHRSDDRRPDRGSQGRYSNNDSRNVDPRQMIVRSILSSLANR